MNRYLPKYLIWLAALLALQSCNVHEFPKAEHLSETQEVLLQLEFKYELPPYKEIIYTQGSSRDVDPSQLYDLRYIINYYLSPNDGKDFPRTPTGSVTVSKDDVSKFNHTVALQLEPGVYKFHAWCDYAAQGSTADRRYNTADFTQISIIFPYYGSDDYVDAFRGELCGVVDEGKNNVFTIDMERPLGKYRFIATDFDRFLSRAEEASRAEWEASRATNPADAPAERPAVNTDDYSVTISYPGYMPHVFNMHTNHPADARTGVSFAGRIQQISDKEAELGFDYLFINGTEAPYTVRVDIRDKKGKLVGSSGNLDIPLMRSMLTTVRGEFLTSQASGGVGVNPDFDGEFNIIIP